MLLVILLSTLLLINLESLSFTSKTSFWDQDEIPIYNADNPQTYVFSGRRIRRGLYRTAAGYCFNADVNGALNIMKKSNVVDLTALYARGEVDMPVRMGILIMTTITAIPGNQRTIYRLSYYPSARLSRVGLFLFVVRRQTPSPLFAAGRSNSAAGPFAVPFFRAPDHRTDDPRSEESNNRQAGQAEKRLIGSSAMPINRNYFRPV